MSDLTLTRNRAQCGNCEDIIESKTRHDFVVCKCWNADAYGITGAHGVFLDGGLSYPRSGGPDFTKLINLMEYEGDANG